MKLRYSLKVVVLTSLLVGMAYILIWRSSVPWMYCGDDCRNASDLLSFLWIILTPLMFGVIGALKATEHRLITGLQILSIVFLILFAVYFLYMRYEIYSLMIAT